MGAVMLLTVGHTWQLYPAYLAVLITIFIIILRKDKKRKVLVSIVLLVLIALSAICLYLLPLLTLPKPSGKYQVGLHYEILQTDRDETLTLEPGDTRKLYLKIWHPTNGGVRKAKYIEGGKETIDFLLNKSNIRIPGFLFHHLSEARTNSYLNAPIANGFFPIVTFSHGHGMWQSQNTSLMEELASQGIVAVSIAHSHQTIFAARSENTMVSFNNIVPLNMDADTLKVKEYLRRIKVVNSKSEMDQLISDNISSVEFQTEFLKVWSADISQTLDMLIAENRNHESIFFQKLDTTKIGVAGMSFGGAAAVETSLHDTRIKAALNMDGKQFGNLISDSTHAKILFLEAKQFDHNLSRFGPFFNRSTDQVTCLMFNNTKHLNFSDIGIFSPALSYLGLLGEVEGVFVVEQINKIVPDFFKVSFNKEPFEADNYLVPEKIILPAE